MDDDIDDEAFISKLNTLELICNNKNKCYI
jgi:hypothetical protein